MASVFPCERKLAACPCDSDLSVRPKHRIRCPHLQQFQLLLYHRFFQTGSHVLFGKVGAIDFFVPAGSGTFHGGVVVLSGEQIQIPDLGLAGHKQLDGTGQQHPAVILAQSAVIGGVHLVIYVFGAVKVFHKATAFDQGINEPLDTLLRQQAL